MKILRGVSLVADVAPYVCCGSVVAGIAWDNLRGAAKEVRAARRGMLTRQRVHRGAGALLNDAAADGAFDPAVTIEVVREFVALADVGPAQCERDAVYLLGLSHAPGRIRTCDPRIRSPMLYPAELRGRADIFSNVGGER